MREPFAIVDVSTSRQVLDEPMGTKEKFWLRDDADQRWLFKYARAGTGEHWAEKIAAEVGTLLGVPCAHVELARCEGKPGCIVRAFPPPGFQAALVHGNEQLQEVDASYPVTQLRGVSKHTVPAVLSVLKGAETPLGTTPPVRAFGVAVGLKPEPAAFWLARLRALGHNDVEDIVNAVPTSLMTDTSGSFAIALLAVTRTLILGH